MIKLGNGLKDAYAVIPLEMVLSIKTHVDHVITVSRSKTASAHTRNVTSKLANPVLEGVVKFITTAKLKPGSCYADQQGIVYYALDTHIFTNVKPVLEVSVYRLPEYLVEVSRANFGERNQLSM